MKVFKTISIYLPVLGFILVLSSVFSLPEQESRRILNEEAIISLAKNQPTGSIVYAASQNYVYKSPNNGRSWQKIYNISQANKKINKLYCDPEFVDNIYLATQDGLYHSQDQGSDWQRIFTGASDLENDCLCIARSKNALYLGTKEGLFIRYHIGKPWVKLFEQFSDSVISSIVVSPEDIVYIATDKGVFKTEDSGKTWKRIYVVYSSEIPEEDYNDYDGDISDKIISIKGMAIPLKRTNLLYILTIDGILSSEDRGKTWKRLTNFGLSSLNMRSIAVSDEGQYLFLATDKGIFSLFKDYWHKIGSSLVYEDFNDLLIDEENCLWIAGKDGVLKISLEEDTFKDSQTNSEIACSKIDIKDLFRGEPPIEQVQRAAIEYAEVNINKIKAWRRQARLKALMPTISLDYDKSVSVSYTSGGTGYVGPRDWNIGFSWNVADLIWSTDQTTIDSRSRLTVQLRQDVLDQVTHLYFERQKLKAELLVMTQANPGEHFYKQLELQEVTANLDALTNGLFSEFLSMNNFE